ncbi:hypothetical protein VNI00_003359 [Paramarasmius palmivorus]|uniref:MYND-type domain-containing protein n=1 Tax=Paramarasmius palmivorus TaxID=297713 RepID=A0AAW0DQI3_9AGAR
MNVMNAAQLNKVLTDIGRNKKKYMDNARKGDLIALRDLANMWLQFPEMLEMGLIDVFLHQLTRAEPPRDNSRRVYERNSDGDRAFMALVGLSKLSNILRDGHPYEDLLLQGWPSIFKWSVYMVWSRVQSKDATPESIRITSDAITACWYSISRTDPVRIAMAKTNGTIEIAAQLWIHEDANLKATIARIRALKACGGDPTKVAQMAMSRLKTAINAPQMHPIRVSIYLDLIGHLSRQNKHPLRNAFLSENMVAVATKLALTLSKMLNGPSCDPQFLDTFCSAMGYLSNFLESTDGFSWIVQSFKRCPYYNQMHPVDQEAFKRIVSDILSRYTVFRSVIRAIDRTMRVLDQEPHKSRVLKSPLKDVYVDFHELALERLMTETVMKHKRLFCDNVKCQKADDKNNFQKCSGCGTTLYCSKECQTIAWKEGGHKQMCKLKIQERREGKNQPISKSDSGKCIQATIAEVTEIMCSVLSRRCCPRCPPSILPHLQRLAKSEFPGVKLHDLIICINYCKVPAKFTLSRLEDYEKMLGEIDSGSFPSAEARTDALIERARNNPGKFAMIQSRISNGIGVQLVTTQVAGDFWQTGSVKDFTALNDGSDEDSEDEELRGTDIDAVELMMARHTIRAIAKSFGEEVDF